MGTRYVCTGNPISDHPLNQRLYGWWLAMPGVNGIQWRDLRKISNGTLTNGMWVPGPVGFPAVRLDGTGDYVTVADRAELDVTDNFTLFVGVRTADTAAKLISKGNTAYQMDINGSNLRFNRQGAAVILQVSIAAYLDDRPHWFAATKSGSNIALYADGHSIATTSSATAIDATADALTFGAEAGGGSDTLIGDLFDIRIQGWLSPSQVWLLTQQARRGHPNTLRYWSRKTAIYSPGSPPPASATSGNLLLLGVG